MGKDFFSIKGVFALRNCVFMGFLAAIAVLLGLYGTVYITATFKAVSFSYLPGAVAAALFGPWAALAFGFVADTVKFVANPQGAYHPGYALSEMAHYFIYACFFYKQRLTLWKPFAARLIVIITVFFGLNFLWQNMMMGSNAAAFFTGVRLINNFVQWPFHALLTYFVCKYTVRLIRPMLTR